MRYAAYLEIIDSPAFSRGGHTNVGDEHNGFQSATVS